MNKYFPNGFDEWQETHYEIVQHFTLTLEKESSAAYRARDTAGHGELYLLAEDWTDEFENLHKGKEWDGDYFDFIEDFIVEKEKHS